MRSNECFGDLDKVFPPGEDGLRAVPSECLGCEDRTQCLKEALNTPKGISLRMERLAQAEEHGLVGKLKRWSRRKALSRILDKQKRLKV